MSLPTSTLCTRQEQGTPLVVQGQANTARRDELLRYQKEAQDRWQQDKIFEVDAPGEGVFSSASFPCLSLYCLVCPT